MRHKGSRMRQAAAVGVGLRCVHWLRGEHAAVRYVLIPVKDTALVGGIARPLQAGGLNGRERDALAQDF
jgi:hypothetical protein